MLFGIYKVTFFWRHGWCFWEQWNENELDLKRFIVMKKAELIRIIQKVLETDATLDFLGKLEKKELETLVACVRDKVDQR